MKETRTPEGKLTCRVFETTWSRSAIYLMDSVTFQEEQFFAEHSQNRDSTRKLREILHPRAISHQELRPFLGKKTRVTIEVIE